MTGAEQIIRAWTLEGTAPQYHRRIKRRLQSEWPVLAAAIEAIIAEQQPPQPPAPPALAPDAHLDDWGD